MRFLFLLFFFTSFNLLAQQATNVKMSTNDEQIIVSYDLEGKPNEVYEVRLQFKRDNDIYLKPQTMRGDVGKVESGKGKAIIWEVYKDVDELRGNLEPEVIVKELAKPKQSQPDVQATPTPPKPPVVDVNKQQDKKNKRRKSDIRTGFKVGLGNTQVDANRPSYQKQFSFEAGVYTRWKAHRRFYLQPEILYHLQAYENLLNNTESITTKNHYARAQVLGGVSPFGFGLYFNGGIYYGYLLGGSERQMLNAGDQTINIQDLPAMNGVESPFNPHDLGYIIGGSFSLFKGSFAIGALWSRSFDNVINTDYYTGDTTNENLSLRNQSYHFFIQKRF